MVNEDYILQRVSKALDIQFEGYSWETMIDDCGLTPKETKWAKEHISYKAYIYK